MKQMAFWLVFAALISALGLWPSEGRDASELLPAQAIVVDTAGARVRVTADCGVTGEGKNLEEALQDMRRRAPGELFLDTAGYVIISGRAWYLLPQAAVSPQLRPAARLCRTVADAPDAEQALEYLQAHPPQMTLARAYADLLQGKTVRAQVLHQTEGGFSLGTQ